MKTSSFGVKVVGYMGDAGYMGDEYSFGIVQEKPACHCKMHTFISYCLSRRVTRSMKTRSASTLFFMNLTNVKSIASQTAKKKYLSPPQEL